MFHSNACKQSPPADLSVCSVVFVFSLILFFPVLQHFLHPPLFTHWSRIYQSGCVIVWENLCEDMRIKYVFFPTSRQRYCPLSDALTLILLQQWSAVIIVSLYFFFFFSFICYICWFSHLKYVIVSLQELIFTECCKFDWLHLILQLNAQAGVMLAVFIFPRRKLENYAYHELKIHYRLSYHNRSDCIGNLPTTVASSSRKSILSLLSLDFHACCLTSLSPHLYEWVCKRIVETVIHHSSASLWFLPFSHAAIVLVWVMHTHRKTLSQCPLWLSRRSLTLICLCSAWGQ